MALPAQAAHSADPARGRSAAPSPVPAVAAFVDAVHDALAAAQAAPALLATLCDRAVDTGGFLSAFVASPNASGGWLAVDAAAGFQAARLPEIRFLAKETPGDPWQWVARAWRHGAPSGPHAAAAWPALHAQAPGAAGHAFPVRRHHASASVLVLWAPAGAPLDDRDVARLQRTAGLVALALDKLLLEDHRAATDRVVRQSEEKYRAILDTMEDAYYEVDVRGKPVYHNAAFARMLGYAPAELLERDHKARQTPDNAARVVRAFNEVYLTGVALRNEEWSYIHKQGHPVHVEGSVQLVRDPHGRPVGFRGILRDVTERRRIEATLRDNEARFRALTSISSDWYWEQDDRHRLVRMENRHARTDALQQAFLGKPIWDSPVTLCDGSDWATHRARLDAHAPFRDVVMQGEAANGQVFYISVSGEPMHDDQGRFQGYRGVTREITAQKVAEAHVQHLATHDALTGLPNRAMLGHLLDLALPTARRYGRRFAVLYLDLDRFKPINDSLGHAAGDALLQEVAQRLRHGVRGSDVVARLGGDEFVVLLQETADADTLAAVARKLLSALLQPYTLSGHACRVTASIGAALFPDHGDDAATLLRHADVAMYHAKHQGRNNFQLYDAALGAHTVERLTVESALREAADRGEFALHYQAKVDVARGHIVGVEALLRWRHATLGQVPPGTFLPVAEDTGLIVPIGRWVLRTACAQAAAWRARRPDLHVAVNVSPRQFLDERFVADVQGILAETGLPPAGLELEITENLLVQDVRRALAVLTALKALGVRIAIDDFGTGYASLGQLKTFPIDTLKVDRSFVRDLASNADDQAITTAIIAMGRTLSLTVVAEGVETQAQQDFLRAHACDGMQGYYVGRPVDADAFGALLQAGPPAG